MDKSRKGETIGLWDIRRNYIDKTLEGGLERNLCIN